MRIKILLFVAILTSINAFSQTTVTDIDGNIYNTVVIGSQVWMKENLNVTHYKNGIPIPNVIGYLDWRSQTIGAYCDYENDTTNALTYGKLYNWYAVANPAGLCPSNWHEPEDWEWNLLLRSIEPGADTSCTNCLISLTAGGAMKDSGLSHWASPNQGATNSSGFTALPGGYRFDDGEFYSIFEDAYFWSASYILLPNKANYRGLYYYDSNLLYQSPNKIDGLSVRCVRDLPYGINRNISADGPTTFCEGDYVNLKADLVPGATYRWQKNGTNLSFNSTSNIYKASNPGNYSCLIIYNNSRIITDTIQVTIKANINTTITANGATSFCSGDSVRLQSNYLGSSYSVQWYRNNISMPFASNYSLLVKQPGIYKVVTKNLANGCSRISSSSVTISVNCRLTNLNNIQTCNSTSNTITADGPTIICAGNYVNLTSDVVGGTYQWKKNGANITTNGTSRTYKATATGSYTCEVTCNGTALTSNAISVTSKTNAAASVSASGATSFCSGDSVTLNCTNLGSNYSVQWYRTNISMENATAYSQVVKQPGTSKVVTKNLTTGCSRISSSSVVVAVNCRLANPDVIAADITESDFDAGTREAEPKGKIYIYPNPTSDNKFTVELMGLELDGAATLEVYNAMGQILSSEKLNITNGTLNRNIQIDEQYKRQLCLVRLIAGSEVYDSKVILK